MQTSSKHVKTVNSKCYKETYGSALKVPKTDTLFWRLNNKGNKSIIYTAIHKQTSFQDKKIVDV